MSKSLFILFSLLLTINAFGQSKLEERIDFSVENIPIADALLSLCEKADLNISFKSSLFSEVQIINCHHKDKSLRYLLEFCLKQTEIGYKLEQNRIILYQKPPPIYTISGYVEDSLSGERLVSATVYDHISGKGTMTNEYGFYSFSIPRGKANLNFSYLGFKSKSYQIHIGKNLSLTIPLKASITLKEITITDSRVNIQTGLAVEETPNYSSKIFQQIPSMVGEPDLLNYIKTMAGIQTAEGSFGGMSVRGGNTDQNLVLLDGVPVYNPSHGLGLFSIFNPNMVKSAQLYKGKFPAKYGGRLSSIIDVQTRDGNKKKFAGELGISLAATNLLLEGPIIKDKTSFLVSVRRTHLDPLIKGVSKLDKRQQGLEGNLNYSFYDINVKLSHTFSPKDRLYLSFYKGGDAYQDENSFSNEATKTIDNFFTEQSDYLRYRWGNNILSLRWNHLWNDQLFSNMTLTFSQFKFQTYYGKETYLERPDSSYSTVQVLNFLSDIKDFALKLDFDYVPNYQHTLKFGGGIYQRFFTPEVLGEELEFEDNFDFKEGDGVIEDFADGTSFFASELNIYGQDNIKLSNKWELEVGLHAVVFISPNKAFSSLQPRLFIQNSISKYGSFYASLSRMTQFLHVLQSYNSGIPNDLWVPATGNTDSQKAWQFSLGTDWKLPHAFTWNVEGYYKKLNDLITYKDGVTFTTPDDSNSFPWEEVLSAGEGWNYGLETSIKRTSGKATGWINYSFSKADRQFDSFNNGQKFPFRYNRTHQLKIGYRQQFGTKFNFFSTYTFGTGQYVTLVKNIGAEELEIIENDILSFVFTDAAGPTNGYQLRDYHRVDLNFNWNWSKKRTEQHFSFGFSNFFNHHNPVYAYQLNAGISLPDEGRIIERGGIGMLPSIRYSLKF